MNEEPVDPRGGRRSHRLRWFLILSLASATPGNAGAQQEATARPRAQGRQQAPLFVSATGAVTELRGVSRGAAWGDVDGDGYPELVVTRPGEERQGSGLVLFRNEGGTLVRGEALPVPDSGWEAVNWVDLDGDGDLDLALVGRHGAGAAFVENGGSGGFETAPDLFAGLVGSATMMCWADADRDGHLDVFVVGYGDEPNRLFRGAGPWTMQPVALPDVALVGGASRACVWADLDDDGLPELVVANARIPNLLLRNRGRLQFVSDTTTALSSGDSYSYGLSTSDVDGDGLLDVFVANFDAPNTLLRGTSDGRLEPVPGAPQSAASKGHSWGDFDLDGRIDLYLGSGTPAPGMFNELYLRTPDGGFRSVHTGVVGEHADTTAAVAASDMDADGDLDLFVANWGSAGSVDRLYRNTTTGASWVKVKLLGSSAGIGARVSIRWTENGRGRSAHRWVTASTGYAGQDDATVHFGVGQGTMIEEVLVEWPSGCRTRHRDVEVRQTLVIRAAPPGDGQPSC